MSARLATEAMATRFELVLDGEETVRLRAAGEAALAEVIRLDAQLSAYRPDSDISWINSHAAKEPVTVEPRLFALLARCLALSAATDGAFDMTIGPLMKAWRFVRAGGAVPEPATLEAARSLVGYQHVTLDPDTRTVRFARCGMAIDLGSAGKGYALGMAVDRLRESGVSRALLHGGTSSVHALASPVDASWRVAWAPSAETRRTFELRDSALSVSASHGKAFRAGDREYGHVMDPRTGWPTQAARSAAVTGPCSLECDVLSTALLVLGPAWLPAMRDRFPEYDGRVA